MGRRTARPAPIAELMMPAPPTHAEQKAMAAEHAARTAVESHPKHTRQIRKTKNAILGAITRSMKGR